MLFTTERFLEVAIESRPEWDLNPRPLGNDIYIYIYIINIYIIYICYIYIIYIYTSVEFDHVVCYGNF